MEHFLDEILEMIRETGASLPGNGSLLLDTEKEHSRRCLRTELVYTQMVLETRIDQLIRLQLQLQNEDGIGSPSSLEGQSRGNESFRSNSTKPSRARDIESRSESMDLVSCASKCGVSAEGLALIRREGLTYARLRLETLKSLQETGFEEHDAQALLFWTVRNYVPICFPSVKAKSSGKTRRNSSD